MKTITYQTYQYRAYTTRTGYMGFNYLLKRCTELYNDSVIERKAASTYNEDKPKEDHIKVNYSSQSKKFTELKQSDLYWQSIRGEISRSILKRVDKAYAFCNKHGFGKPRIKTNKIKSLELNPANKFLKQMVKYHGNKILVKIKGLPTIKVLHDPIDLPDIEQLVKLIITAKAGKLYVALVYAEETDIPEFPANPIEIGGDMGVTTRLTLSDGTEYPRRERNTKIDDLHRELSRKTKGSRSWHKVKAKLAREYHRDAVSNRNECHRITSEIVKKYDQISIENLPIKNMTKSNKGTIENPGKNRKQKTGLNRSVRRQTWYLLRSQLTYKAERAGKILNAVDPKYTSQECHICLEKGYRKAKVFICYPCDIIMDADINAARNIKFRGGNKVLESTKAPLAGSTDLAETLIGLDSL